MARTLARIAIVMAFVACFLGHARRPPVADEIDFVKPIADWAATGPQTRGLWHSPLYPWLLSMIGQASGMSVGALRLVGLLSTAATALLLQLALVRARRAPGWSAELLLALSLLAPVSLGSALLLDYDTTLLTAATALYFYLLVTQASRPKPPSPTHLVVVFGPALAIALLGKETTPLVYPLALVVAFRSRLGLKRTLAASTMSLLVGVAIFLAVATTWCAAYALPLSAVFEMDLLGLRVHGLPHAPASGAPTLGAALAASVWVKALPAIWLGLPLTLVFAARLPKLLRRADAVGGIAAAVCAVLLAYTFALRQMTYHFPKYMAPVLPWVAWLVVAHGEGQPSQGRGRQLHPVTFAWAFAIVAWFLVSWDPLRIVYFRDARAALLYVAELGVPAAVYFGLRATGRAVPSLGGFALLLTLGLASSYALESLLSPKSVTYWYGENAIGPARRLAETWRAQNPTGRLYVPTKDIAYLTRDLGSQFRSKDDLTGHGQELCADPSPLLILTRAREDSSLIHAPELADVRRCLGTIIADGDIAYGTIHSEHR